MNYLPLWSGIMRAHFKYGSKIATSSFVEAEFSQLKTRVFKNQLPMRIDKFILCHLEYLEGKLLLVGTSDQKTPIDKNISSSVKILDNPTIHQNESSYESYSIENNNKRENKNIDTEGIENKIEIARDSLNEIENWRCKICLKLAL